MATFTRAWALVLLLPGFCGERTFPLAGCASRWSAWPSKSLTPQAPTLGTRWSRWQQGQSGMPWSREIAGEEPPTSGRCARRQRRRGSAVDSPCRAAIAASAASLQGCHLPGAATAGTRLPITMGGAVPGSRGRSQTPSDRSSRHQAARAQKAGFEVWDSLAVPDGPYVGRSAEAAFEDQPCRETASKWRPGAGALAKAKRDMMVWAKMVEAFMGLEGRGGDNNVPAVAPPLPDDYVIGDAPRATDEPPGIVPEGLSPGAAGLQPPVRVPEPPAVREQQNRLRTIVEPALGQPKANRGGLLMLGVSLVMPFPKLSAAGLVLRTEGLLMSLTHVLAQVTGQLTRELCPAGLLRALTTAENDVLVTLTGGDSRFLPREVSGSYAHGTPSASSPGPPRAPPDPPIGWLPWLRACFVGAEAASAIWTLLLLRHRPARGGGGGGG